MKTKINRIIYSTRSFSLVALVLLPFLLAACGDPGVDIVSTSANNYVPKIAVAGYLYLNEPVKDIRIMRNFALNTPIDTATLILRDATVTLNGVPLYFNPATLNFENPSIIVTGQKYELKVTAMVDGKQLTTSSTTTVPATPFHLLTKNLGTIRYKEKIEIPFTPSPNVDFYAFSVIPLTATLDNFIYDNDVNPSIKRQDLEEDFNNYRYQYNFMMDAVTDPTKTLVQPIRTFDTWFYSDYRVIVYAVDKNMKDYLLTGRDVQEMDGNFHEPKLHLTGDGIGIFGSAVRDTLYFKLIPAN